MEHPGFFEPALRAEMFFSNIIWADINNDFN